MEVINMEPDETFHSLSEIDDYDLLEECHDRGLFELDECHDDDLVKECEDRGLYVLDPLHETVVDIISRLTVAKIVGNEAESENLVKELIYETNGRIL
jgi:hypothetical protein